MSSTVSTASNLQLVGINGTRWVGFVSPRAVDWLIDGLLPEFDWVRVSIDAASQEQYVKTRNCPPGHWDKVWANVKQLAAVIERQESDTVFGLGFVVTPDSYRGIPEFAQLAKDAGAHNIRYTAMFSTEDEKPFIPIFDECKAFIDQAKCLADDNFQVYDNFGSRFEDLQPQHPDYKDCSYQWYTAYIGDDLKIYRCCVLAYNKRGLLPDGDLTKISFADYWRDFRRIGNMREFDARDCPRCQFNEKNRTLLYVMGNTASDTSPRHMEWT